MPPTLTLLTLSNSTKLRDAELVEPLLRMKSSLSHLRPY